jgi:hypothetical protein
VSSDNNSWFHCGRCGALFLSIPGDVENRLCTECGSHPSLGLEPPVILPVRQPAQPAAPAEREKHTHRRKKSSHFMVKLLLAWMIFIGLIIFGARRLFDQDPSRAERPVTSVTKQKGPTEEELAFIREASASCHQTFQNFLSAASPEERNQFVLNPVNTASRMARFLSMNPRTNIDPATLTLESSAVVDLPNGRGLENVWKAGGDRIDTVFLKENGEWRLDWEHFVRYSDFPWSLFLAGSGDPSGEFRLLARERLADERKDADTISMVLYAPRFGSENETGLQSPEFLVKRDSENGRLLEAAFQLERSGERVFGVRTPMVNPEKLIRVRVKVRRIEENMKRSFVIDEVIACHWYSVDEPGVTPATPAADQPAGD